MPKPTTCERYIPGVAFERTCRHLESGLFVWEEQVASKREIGSYKLSNEEVIAQLKHQVASFVDHERFLFPSAKTERLTAWGPLRSPLLLVDTLYNKAIHFRPEWYSHLGEALALLHSSDLKSSLLPQRNSTIVEHSRPFSKALTETNERDICVERYDYPPENVLIHGRFSSAMIPAMESPSLFVSYEIGLGNPLLDLSHFISEIWEFYCLNQNNRAEQEYLVDSANGFLSGYSTKKPIPAVLANELPVACRYRSSVHVLILSYLQRDYSIIKKHLATLDANAGFFNRIEEALNGGRS